MSSPPASAGQPTFVTSTDWGEVIPAFFTVVSGTTLTLGSSNSPATSGTQPYCYFQVNAPDGTKVYIPAWK